MSRFKVFGATPESGNDAILITGDGVKDMDQRDRQDFAAKTKVSACVFMETNGDGKDLVLDYYYPHTRSPLCLHASLAAACYRLQNEDDSIRMVTSVGKQLLTFRKSGLSVFVRVAKQEVAQKDFSKQELAELLHYPTELLVAEPVTASVGSVKLLLEFPDRESLYQLKPDLAGIAKWGADNGVNGFYAYVKTGLHTYEGRSFNHLDPAMEDLATGVAAGALSVNLQSGITIYQGHNLGNPCKIQTFYSNDSVEIGGLVVEYAE